MILITYIFIYLLILTETYNLNSLILDYQVITLTLLNYYIHINNLITPRNSGYPITSGRSC